jgi:two-component system, NarL family, response regulator NreC
MKASAMTTRIFLVDDHHLVRQGLRLLLEAESDFEVIGEAGDGIEAVEAVLRLPPDILIVDVVLPNLNGIEVTRSLKQRLPGLKVILLSMYATEAYVSEALQAGASAYVLKKSTAEELVYAIREALAGRMHLSPPLNERALLDYSRRSAETPGAEAYDRLTKRERQVLQMAAEGLKNPQIAERLSISARTVEMHRANLLHKLSLKNQTELVRFAVKRGLVV